MLAQLVQMDVPTVSHDPDPGLKSFRWWQAVNYQEAAVRLIDHMRSRGARRICALVGQTDNDYRRAILAAYRAASRTQPGGSVVRVIDNSLGQEGARLCVTKLLKSSDPPDAVMTSSSVFAQGSLTAATTLGHRVPDDFRIGACSDGPAAEFASVPITALRLDNNAAAENLLDLLVTRMDGRRHPAPLSQIAHQQLVQRMST